MSRAILETLEFDQVLDKLSAQCQYSVARERALELGPVSDRDHVRYLLSVTREATELLTDHVDFSVRGVRDIRDAVERAAKGALLTPGDLREVLDSLQAIRNTRRSFERINEREAPFENLAHFVEQFGEFAPLETDLNRTVGPQAEILDSASSDLGRIRSQIKTSHRRLLDRLNRLTADSRYQPALQESIVTMRQGRYVVPVRSDRRSQIPGIVQGTSASGQTLFVEPMDVVELNNHWRQLQMEEEHEIERILRARTDDIGAVAEDLSRAVEAIAALDVSLAKARLAFQMRAVEPEINTRHDSQAGGHNQHWIRLVEARHPLIDPNEVVPINVDMGVRSRILVLTGPNTGGKTVALKTVGLLVLMSQTGLFIPARDGSSLSVFDAVYADIGDEQSIEQSLSTFSSHITRIIAMLRQANADSLVLLDEIGAGTDPEEGSALARAIIDALLARGCLGLVTTHYSELKSYAYVTEGTENASVEFDLETLRPTYRLLVGVAGQSNALAIAERLGMPREIIEDARALIEPDSREADQMLDEIRTRLSAAEEAAAAAARERETMTQLREQLEEARREAEEARFHARQEVLAELQDELNSARSLIRRLENAAASQAPASQQRDARAEIAESREKVDQLEREARRRRRRPPRQKPDQQPVRIGDAVEIPSLGMTGEVLGFSDSGEDAEIQVGAFKVSQPVAVLKRVGGSGRRQRVQASVSVPPAPRVENEIHFRGMRAEEVVRRLDEYLDDAAHASLPWVRIVHGKGTGALRSAVQEVLKHHPAVSKFESAPVQEGGDGVTIAYFKG
jgi:DNA mismatch repair protein MutS2